MNIEDIIIEVKRWGGFSKGKLKGDIYLIEFPDAQQTASFKDWCDNNEVGFSSNNSHMVIVGDHSDVKWLV